MRLLLVSLLLAAAPAFAAEPLKPAEPVRDSPIQVGACDAEGRPMPVNRTTAPRLGDLPPANLERTVLRRIGRCVVPVIVRYGVDEKSAPSAPRR